MSRGRLLAIASLLIVAVLSRWLLLRSTEPVPGDELPVARPDYSLDQFQLRAMNEVGQPRFVLTAPRMERNPRDGSALVRTPLLELFDAGRVAWTVDAGHAWIRDDGQEIRLIEDVDLLQIEGTETRLATEALLVYPDGQIIETDLPVTIRRQHNLLQGTGLEARLNDNRWELKSDVKSIYYPPRG